MNKYLLVALFLLTGITSNAQTPTWGFHVGGSTADNSHVVKVAPNGNVYIGGSFTGTMDLDPSGLGVYTVTSAGQDDIWLACYNSAGVFLWGFRVGGTTMDQLWRLNVDVNSDVIITGYFQGAGVDFDPGPGVTAPPFAGGTGPGGGGDGFVAKYSSAGVFQWVHSIGGNTIYDLTEEVDTDPAGNVYISGEATDAYSIGAFAFNSATNGKSYIAKLSPAGAVVWAHAFGSMGITAMDSNPWGMRVKNGYIYVAGVFQATANFNPWGLPATLTSAGTYDGFLAKYDVSGNFVFVNQISGGGALDEFLTLEMDDSDNVYIAGRSNSPTITYDATSPGTSTFVAPGGGGNNDIIFAKYNKNGQYKWGMFLGANTGDDQGWALTVIGNYIYLGGQFRGTIDLDPTAGVGTVTSSGATDLVVSKYTRNGAYVCGFSVGSAATDDICYGLAHDATGNLYTTGQFGGSAVDFNPTAGSFPLTSFGGTDAFLIKYSLVQGATYSGTFRGDSICSGQTADLTLTVTGGGPGPYDITFSDGVNVYTRTGVVSGVPFSLVPSPTTTTTYTLLSITATGSTVCIAPSGSSFGTATVVVVPAPTVNITTTYLSCRQAQFSATGTDSLYSWDFGDGTTGTGNPVVHTFSTTGTFIVTLTQTNRFNCSTTDTVHALVTPAPTVNLGPDITLCSGNTALLASTIAYSAPTYLWSTGSGVSSIGVTVSGTYWLQVTQSGCIGSDTINVNFIPTPVVDLGRDTGFCVGQTLVLQSPQPVGSVYTWSTGSALDSIHVTVGGTYWLSVNYSGCITTDTIVVLVSVSPPVDLGNDTIVCFNNPVSMQSSYTYTGATYYWSDGTALPVATATVTGTYWLRVTKDGCPGTDTIGITIYNDTFHLFNNDTSICIGQQVPVVLNATPFATFQWVPTAGIAAPTLQNPKIAPDTSAMYYVTISLNGCPDMHDSFYIDVQPYPTFFAGGNHQVCEFDTLHLETNVWPRWYTKYSYSWTPPIFLDDPAKSNVVFTAAASGVTKYMVNVTTPRGCSTVDSVEITVHPGNFITMDTTMYKICPHETVQFNAQVNGGSVPATFVWRPGTYLDDSTLQKPTVSAVNDITYTAVATDLFGCKDTIQASVMVYPGAQIYLGDSVELRYGESYHITPQTNCTRFTWYPPAGLNNAYISDPIAEPVVNTKYKVLASTDNGCEVNDSISIYYEVSSILRLPNAFTPGSSVNNTLKLIKLGPATLTYFRIFDRWGTMVFETKNIDEGWDGTAHGKPQPFGVYVYQIEAVTRDGEIFERKGNVTLVR